MRVCYLWHVPPPPDVRAADIMVGTMTPEHREAGVDAVVGRLLCGEAGN